MSKALGLALLSLALACGDDVDVGGDTTGTSSASSSSTSPSTSGATGESSGTGTGTDTSAGTSSDGDHRPAAPVLVSPLDGTVDAPGEIELCWEPVEAAADETIVYTVFVDDTELLGGITADGNGFVGPCVGPLSLVPGRTYVWSVVAFVAAEPTLRSDPSPTWSLTTATDEASTIVFEDDFEADRGWEVSGDAARGAWIRDRPLETAHQGRLAQPGRCAEGSRCFFTGQNPRGMPSDADVDGGVTILTSPPFDLSGAATATVRLRRFFYDSDATAAPSLRVDLLVPSVADPRELEVYPLELLEFASVDAPENRWTPREYAACDVPMREGSRLAITATDEGAGILEAAIDFVSVRAHASAALCEGRYCDVSALDACPGIGRCCPVGTMNEGVYRCADAVRSLDPEDPPALPESPGNGPLGCDAPDLVVDPSFIDPVLVEDSIEPNSCELLEGCVGDVGARSLLRFSLSTRNIGSRDLVLGIAANYPDTLHYAECHMHYHLDDYAMYELVAGDDVIARGQKSGFCLLDTGSWAWPTSPAGYDCINQGISRGAFDMYELDLPCQWIDVTGVPAGDYVLRVTVNPTPDDAALPQLVERDYGNNTVDVPVTIP